MPGGGIQLDERRPKGSRRHVRGGRTDWAVLGQMIRRTAHLAAAEHVVRQAQVCVPEVATSSGDRGRSS